MRSRQQFQMKKFQVSRWSRWIHSQVLCRGRRLQGKRLNELQPRCHYKALIINYIYGRNLNQSGISKQLKCNFHLCPQFQGLGCHPFRLSTSGKIFLLEFVNVIIPLPRTMSWRNTWSVTILAASPNTSVTLETLLLSSWWDHEQYPAFPTLGRQFDN